MSRTKIKFVLISRVAQLNSTGSSSGLGEKVQDGTLYHGDQEYLPFLRMAPKLISRNRVSVVDIME